MFKIFCFFVFVLCLYADDQHTYTACGKLAVNEISAKTEKDQNSVLIQKILSAANIKLSSV